MSSEAYSLKLRTVYDELRLLKPDGVLLTLTLDAELGLRTGGSGGAVSPVKRESACLICLLHHNQSAIRGLKFLLSTTGNFEINVYRLHTTLVDS